MTERFILVKCQPDPSKQAYVDAGWSMFRATCAPLDFFFWAPDDAHARRLVRRKFPGCTFSDEDQRCN